MHITNKVLCIIPTKDLHNQWRNERDNLLRSFQHILTIRKKKGADRISGNFYDSSKYPLLTKVIDHDTFEKDYESESESESMDVDDSGHEQTPKKVGGQPGYTKSFEELTSNDRKRKRSQKAYDAFAKWCKEEGLPFDKGLFYMGRRHYLSTENEEDYDFRKGTIFNEIYKGKELLAYRHSLSAKQGKYLQTSLDIGREKWQLLRKFLDPVLDLPSPDRLRIFQNQIMPKYESTINDGLWIDLPTLAKVHATSTIEELTYISEENLEHIAEHGVVLIGDGGADGSGQHSKFR